MGVRRTELAFEGQYVQIPNAWMRDRQLSRKARGLLAEIMTHRVGWHVTTRSLTESGTEGRHAILGGLSELVEAGYLRRVQGRGERGTFGEIEYELCEPTAVGKSDHGEETPDQTVVGLSAVGLSDVGKSAPKNTRDKEHQTEEYENTLSLIPRASFDDFWSVWPKKNSKKDAQRAWEKAVKVADPDVIVSAARAYVASPYRPDLKYVPYGATWLNKELWNDPVPEQQGGRHLSLLDVGRAADALLHTDPHLRALS